MATLVCKGVFTHMITAARAITAWVAGGSRGVLQINDAAITEMPSLPMGVQALYCIDCVQLRTLSPLPDTLLYFFLRWVPAAPHIPASARLISSFHLLALSGTLFPASTASQT